MTLRAALHQQAEVTEALGSPFTAQVLRVIAERISPGSDLTDRLLTWSGDISASGQSVPLRLAGALHGLVLDGADADLAAVYPPNDAPSDAALWGAIQAALDSHSARVDTWLNSAPQTNEVARSAVLIAAAHFLADVSKPWFDLYELGASAGLNLYFDRYRLDIGSSVFGPQDAAVILRPKWTGSIPKRASAAAPVNVFSRQGVDLNPLSPNTSDDQLRLLAYVWPDQAERMARIRAACQVADDDVVQGDAAEWIAAQLATKGAPDRCRLIFHTVAWQYFPREVQARAQAAIEAAGAESDATSPLAWLRMEADGQTPGAGVSLRFWPGDRYFDLGRADFHGRWIDWAPKEVE